MPTGIYVRTKEYREIMRKVMHKAWGSGKMQGARGIKHTEAWKERQSKVMKEKELPQAFKKGKSPSNKGKQHLRGEKHWNWQGGIDEEHKRIKQSAEYKEWRNAVYKKDNWTCVECKEHCDKKTITAHHIKEFYAYPELRFVVSNGEVLCRKCHQRKHKPRRNNYYEQRTV